MGRRRAAAPLRKTGDATTDPRYVTALARGIELLRAFKPQDRWLSHGEIVRRTALPRATVSRLTFTLTALGYLQHRDEAGEYALSPAVLGLGFAMLGNFDIARIARPTLQALADRCKAAVSLGARHNLEMIYVAHCRSTARLILGLDVGARLPLARTAMGRAVLCATPTIERELLLEGIASAEGDGWPPLSRRLTEVQAQLDARGFVTTEGEWDPAISAAAVPVNLGDGRTLLGLSVGGASTWLNGTFLHDEVGPLLVSAAAEIVAAIHAAAWKN
ncbi:IclR family transcriptional regulator [Variovorax sp. J22P240]|uniref:IclR family transcriptional regulator n=1 Tax=Variovorax sp. J22P240 TaxID=3053514 RepID=UPI0025761F03|nr:IclR family transcriptional regulator [Variovorax sp. J22P240]MDM0001076.1 IclR family transcriptional regulator [Variovorax sp. J22P240]